MPTDSKPARILAIVAPEEAEVAREVARSLTLPIEVVGSMSEGFSLLSKGTWSLTLVSLSLEWMDLATVERIAESDNAGVLLVGSRSASLELTIAITRAGGTLLREPLKPAQLSAEFEALTRDRSRDRDIPLPLPARTPGPAGTPGTAGTSRIVGSGPRMMEIFQLIAKVSGSSATVLLMGESGTGKELFARAIHDASPRHASPFVAINCAAIPEHLLESELFGHERGAFTGAVDRLVGRFERADGGTLLLDEIGDMSMALQAKVLRVLEEREVERLGGGATVPVDVRIIAATNRSLLRDMGSGAFREDLYHRLAVVRLDLPPLRERQEDLEELVLHFAGTFATRYERPVRFLSRSALARLRAHEWPGNVRELRNVLDRAVLIARGETIMPEDLRLGEEGREDGAGGDVQDSSGPDTILSLAEAEAEHIARVLRVTDGHMGETAELLGIHRNTLTRKVREYGLVTEASK